MASAACGGAGSPFLSHTHSADHRRVPEPRAGVATYFFSASVEGSSNLSPKANEERLPWTSPETAFLAEVGSSRPGTGAKMLQGRQGGEGALSGGTARGEGPGPGSRLARRQPVKVPVLRKMGAGASPPEVDGGRTPGSRDSLELSCLGFCLQLDLPLALCLPHRSAQC